MIAVRLRKQAWFVACVVLACPVTMSAQSTEFIANEGPAPDSVEELHGPIVIAFPDAEERPDAHANANFRTYYFLRDNGITALIEENEAWAAGGTVAAFS